MTQFLLSTYMLHAMECGGGAWNSQGVQKLSQEIAFL